MVCQVVTDRDREDTVKAVQIPDYSEADSLFYPYRPGGVECPLFLTRRDL